VIVNYFDDLSRWVIRSGEIWIAVLLGVAALVLLFAKGRRPILAAGGTLAVVALFGSWYVDHPTVEPLLSWLMFGLFASMSIASAVLMLIQRHPVYSALFFALTILATAGMFVLASAPFLAAALVIVYAGAIIVTFLFVVMLAQQSGLAAYDQRFWNPLPASLAAGILVATILTVLNGVYSRTSSAEAIVVRLEQLQRELGAPNLNVSTAREPTLLGKSYSELLAVDLKDVGGVEGENLKTSLSDATQTWDAAWHGRLLETQNRQPGASKLNQTVEPQSDAPEITPQQSHLLLAAKKMHFVARRIQTARGARPTIAQPQPAEAQRLSLERSWLSSPNLDDKSMVRALGRSLWGDYLIGVELAGTLLLVAAVGAVAVNIRRKEAPL
jgi:NADH:ubiquinone oxidoreductase subunit 6 (subunit J)